MAALRRTALAAMVLAALLACGAWTARAELDGFEVDDDEAGDEQDDGFGAAAAAAAAEKQAAQLREQQAARAAVETKESDAKSGSEGEEGEAEDWREDGVDKVEGMAGGGSSRSGHSVPLTGVPLSAVADKPVLRKFWAEAAALAFLVIYVINFFIGKSKNEEIALAWANTFCTPGAIMERNFSLLGTGDTEEGEIMMKESHSLFKFYASGRRYCQGMLASLDLKRRQDLLSYLLHAVFPKDDTLEVEVYMNEACMPPLVMALGHTRQAREAFRGRKDVSQYAKLVSLRDRLPKFDADHFACYSESKDVAADLLLSALDDVVVEDAWEAAGQYLQSVVVSSENAEGSHKKLIRIVYKLPPPKNLPALAKALSSLPAIIDAVGSYKMSAETKRRAEKEFNTRQKQEERQEIANKKRQEKLEAEKERMKKMTPEARAKAQEKQEKLMTRRNLRTRTKMVK
eukprot:CAMPEP_0177787980 /NCGR_PEP_ID=MMETSP0491_2-20121128/21835_1 /TAXON_ID=63592 /ORGANISM="Tetraselmis chuii, Strain PLY429" /LENGTH=457 /DNA_ID=CAMNT_0019309473 /DNA_START=276 /DNA_END=1649 /DNA_ORIENTATION=-